MLGTTVTDAYYTPITGISNTLTKHLNDYKLPSLPKDFIFLAPNRLIPFLFRTILIPFFRQSFLTNALIVECDALRGDLECGLGANE